MNFKPYPKGAPRQFCLLECPEQYIIAKHIRRLYPNSVIGFQKHDGSFIIDEDLHLGLPQPQATVNNNSYPNISPRQFYMADCPERNIIANQIHHVYPDAIIGFVQNDGLIKFDIAHIQGSLPQQKPQKRVASQKQERTFDPTNRSEFISNLIEEVKSFLEEEEEENAMEEFGEPITSNAFRNVKELLDEETQDDDADSEKSSEGNSIVERLRQLFPNAKIAYINCDEEDDFQDEDDSEEEDYSAETGCQKEEPLDFHQQMHQERCFNPDIFPEFISTLVNEVDSSKEEEGIKEVIEGLEDRITANVLRTVKSYLNIKASSEESQENSNESEQNPTPEPKSEDVTKSSERTESLEQTEDNQICVPYTVYSRKEVLIEPETATPSSESKTSKQKEEAQNDNSSNGTDTVALQQLETNIFDKVLEHVNIYLMDNMTDYVDILLDEGLRRLQRELLERLTDRVDLRSVNSVNNFLCDSIEKGLGDKACQALQKRVTDNVVDQISDYLHNHLVEYISQNVLSKAKSYMDVAVEEFLEQKIQCNKANSPFVPEAEEEDDFEYDNDYEESVDDSKEKALINDTISRDCNAFGEKNSNTQATSQNESCSSLSNPEPYSEKKNRTVNFTASTNPFLTENLDNNCPREQKEICDNSVQEDSFTDDQPFDDTEGMQEYYAQNKDFLNALPEAPSDIESEKKESTNSLYDNTTLYPQEEIDPDAIDDEDPFDDNDDLFNDELLMQRLLLGWRGKSKANNCQDTNSKSSLPVMKSGTLTREYVDPITGRVIEVTNSFKTFFEEEKGPRQQTNTSSDTSTNTTADKGKSEEEVDNALLAHQENSTNDPDLDSSNLDLVEDLESEKEDASDVNISAFQEPNSERALWKSTLENGFDDLDSDEENEALIKNEAVVNLPYDDLSSENSRASVFNSEDSKSEGLRQSEQFPQEKVSSDQDTVPTPREETPTKGRPGRKPKLYFASLEDGPKETEEARIDSKADRNPKNEAAGKGTEGEVEHQSRPEVTEGEIDSSESNSEQGQTETANQSRTYTGRKRGRKKKQ